MSLRTRLIASIILALLVSLGVGCASAGWNAARSVRTEVQAALAVGEQAVRHGLDDLPGSHDASADLGRLVQAFGGDRHARAVLLDAAGHALVASAPPKPAQLAIVAFWQARRLKIGIALEVAADEDSLDEGLKAVIYRVAQEGLSNAVWDRQPGRIEVSVAPGKDGGVVVRVSDDGIGMTDVTEPGLGVSGMRERVSALGGALQVAGGPGGRGLAVTARLPPRAEGGARPTAAA